MAADRADTEAYAPLPTILTRRLPVLAKYSKGKQVNKLDLEENGSKISVEDLEKGLDANGLR